MKIKYEYNYRQSFSGKGFWKKRSLILPLSSHNLQNSNYYILSKYTFLSKTESSFTLLYYDVY